MNLPVAIQLWWFIPIAALAGVLFTSFIGRIIARREAAEAFERGLQQNAEQSQINIRLIEERLTIRSRDLTRMEGRVEVLETQLRQSNLDLAEQNRSLASAQAQYAALNATLEESRKSFAEKEAVFREGNEAMKLEFENLANRIFERQGEVQQQKLFSVLSPFKDQIVDFKKRVEEVYHTDTKDRASLLTEVRNLQKSSERINEEAENLTRALKGDVKLQGNWGEMVLERVLEESGLRRDHEYFLQEAQRSASGELKRPDALIRLPDDKDVIIDAKVSLVAYERALASEDDESRAQAMGEYLVSLRAHVKRLSEQDYDQLKDVRSLDFVLMFLPIESAFTIAMEHDQRLFSDAFDRRIVIVSPTTLMMTLRIIHTVWRYEKQSRNAEEIARRGGALYDKLRIFIGEMEQLGKQIDTVDRTYQSAFSKLTTGKANLVKQVEQFRELGAKVKKPISKNLISED